jgi:hypothetical protein
MADVMPTRATTMHSAMVLGGMSLVILLYPFGISDGQATVTSMRSISRPHFELKPMISRRIITSHKHHASRPCTHLFTSRQHPATRSCSHSHSHPVIQSHEVIFVPNRPATPPLKINYASGLIIPLLRGPRFTYSYLFHSACLSSNCSMALSHILDPRSKPAARASISCLSIVSRISAALLI